MGSGEDNNKKPLELIGSIIRRLLSQKATVGKNEVIDALELLSKSTADRHVRENSLKAIQMLNRRIH
ncbi:hypothetical protein F3I35_10185 [Pantoea sp. Bo_7]|uniref:hypothetical protein n=1 Tax=unclassified Pantoea TaxID=2630326 RepID=UPI001231873E|nr:MULTISPECIES: hypothetical protein [unclassified Pantoea]KAA6046643.1 hypothetical protein F3I35_10185 [Pantoea sp. Bo_7]KAA6091872.1 hypothetical protein F3I22_10190 [Pantoea sp. Bo_10]